MALLMPVQNKKKRPHCHKLLMSNLKETNPKNPFKYKVKSELFLYVQQFLLTIVFLVLIEKKKKHLHYHQLLELNLKKINQENLSKEKIVNVVPVYSQSAL